MRTFFMHFFNSSSSPPAFHSSSTHHPYNFFFNSTLTAHFLSFHHHHRPYHHLTQLTSYSHFLNTMYSPLLSIHQTTTNFDKPNNNSNTQIWYFNTIYWSFFFLLPFIQTQCVKHTYSSLFNSLCIPSYHHTKLML